MLALEDWQFRGSLCFASATSPFIGKRAGRQRTCMHVPRVATSQRSVSCVADEPPKVKPSFYKNPSKAIEKGGGFYIPGLRGPRLRVFVACAGGGLLTLNHLASIRSVVPMPPSFSVSEFTALSAVLAVGLSAYLDIRRDSLIMEADSATPAEDTGLTAGDEVVSKVEGAHSTFLGMGAVEWLARTATELTATDAVYLFEDGILRYASNGTSVASTCGAVVERVANENKAIYLDDTKKLPDGIDLPFLGGGEEDGFCAFVVPIREGRAVIVYSAALSNEDARLPARDRAWLLESSFKIEQEWGNAEVNSV